MVPGCKQDVNRSLGGGNRAREELPLVNTEPGTVSDTVIHDIKIAFWE